MSHPDESIMSPQEALGELFKFLHLTSFTEHYTSTACYHQTCGECRERCKFCNAPCRCICHVP